jgi:hypothetical protein
MLWLAYLRRRSTEKVETVIITLWIWDLANTRFLEKISSNSCTGYSSILIKLNLNKFSKTAAGKKKQKKIEVDVKLLLVIEITNL